MVVGGAKIGETIVFLVNPYYVLSTTVLNDNLWCSFQYKIAILIECACDNESGDEEVS